MQFWHMEHVLDSDPLGSPFHHYFHKDGVEDYDVDVRNIRNGVVDIRNNVVVKCCK